jgi:hypothetical protein
VTWKLRCHQRSIPHFDRCTTLSVRKLTESLFEHATGSTTALLSNIDNERCFRSLLHQARVLKTNRGDVHAYDQIGPSACRVRTCMIGPDHIIAPYKQDHIVVSMSDVFSHKSHFHRTCCQHRAVSTPVNIINQHTYIVGAYAEERLGLFNVERARSILEFDLGAKRERYRVFLRPWQHETKEESWKESGGILPCYTRMFTAISVLRYRFGISIKQAKTREKHRFY